MAREKSPGLKVLWVWTIGTAAILVGSVVRNRLKDMDEFLNADQKQQEAQEKEQENSQNPPIELITEDTP